MINWKLEWETNAEFQSIMGMDKMKVCCALEWKLRHYIPEDCMHLGIENGKETFALN